jgi:uncharacterized membrane protein YdjX (TVP38/TMEM64 family)
MISRNRVIAIVVAILALLGVAWLYRVPLWETAGEFYRLVSDRDRIQGLIAGFGTAAPLVFMALQVLQVVVAPLPGEATGFIGGFLFGTLWGLVYSSIGLTIGSWINFCIGKALGHRYVRKLIPEAQLDRMDLLLRRQGLGVVFVLFLIPGFPKDYLCLFLGLSTMPMKVFLLLAAVGRVPGTLLLSLQGAALSGGDYRLFVIVTVGCIALAWAGYRYRERLYQWAERLDETGKAP